MSDSRRVVITGLGAVSSLGCGADRLWSGVVQGKSGISQIDDFVRLGLPITTGGAIPEFEIDREGSGAEIASMAIDEALNQAGLIDAQCGFIWSTGLDAFRIRTGELTWTPTGALFTSLARGWGGPNRMIAMACASGTAAVGEAFWLIRSGRASACMAGASSRTLTPFYILGFAGLHALATLPEDSDPSTVCKPFDRARTGFALSDGAGAAVLESLPGALKRGAAIIAEVAGYGASQDAFDLNRPCDDGAGAALSMQRALHDAGVNPGAVAAINAHGTGTYVGDPAEAIAIRSVFGMSSTQPLVSSVKGAIGHAQAAAGALEAIVGAMTCSVGVVPATINLRVPDDRCDIRHVIGESIRADVPLLISNSFGMGGQNATIVLKRYDY